MNDEEFIIAIDEFTVESTIKQYERVFNSYENVSSDVQIDMLQSIINLQTRKILERHCAYEV